MDLNQFNWSFNKEVLTSGLVDGYSRLSLYGRVIGKRVCKMDLSNSCYLAIDVEGYQHGNVDYEGTELDLILNGKYHKYICTRGTIEGDIVYDVPHSHNNTVDLGDPILGLYKGYAVNYSSFEVPILLASLFTQLALAINEEAKKFYGVNWNGFWLTNILKLPGYEYNYPVIMDDVYLTRGTTVGVFDSCTIDGVDMDILRNRCGNKGLDDIYYEDYGPRPRGIIDLTHVNATENVSGHDYEVGVLADLIISGSIIVGRDVHIFVDSSSYRDDFFRGDVESYCLATVNIDVSRFMLEDIKWTNKQIKDILNWAYSIGVSQPDVEMLLLIFLCKYYPDIVRLELR